MAAMRQWLLLAAALPSEQCRHVFLAMSQRSPRPLPALSVVPGHSHRKLPFLRHHVSGMTRFFIRRGLSIFNPPRA